MINHKNTTECINKSFRRCGGFTLVEIITVLTIVGLVMSATLTVYSRVRGNAERVTEMLDKDTLPAEILHRIAEDIDRMTTAGTDTKITIANKVVEDYASAMLSIKSVIYNSKNKEETLEEITWHTAVALSAATYEPTLMLFRTHGGISLEDTMFDTDSPGLDFPSQAELQEAGSQQAIPLCEGLTFFEIAVPKGDTFLDKWNDKKLPNSIVFTLSFSDPKEMEDGYWGIDATDIYVRTIAVDRTRKIKFSFVAKEYSKEDFGISDDPNEPGAAGETDENASMESDDGLEADTESPTER
jgi:prepilin-type N-terminal cleavage/methylation domain-containing protein